jgi:hypothetical protein
MIISTNMNKYMNKKMIPIWKTNEKGILIIFTYAIIDVQDLKLVSQYKWYADGKGYAITTGAKHKTIRMHRLILNPKSKKLHCHHKDHCVLNNSRDNIMLTTQQKNSQSYSKPVFKDKKPTSKYLGVSWNRFAKSWMACISLGAGLGNKTIGYFKDEMEAAQKYNEWAKKIRGQFAMINEI